MHGMVLARVAGIEDFSILVIVVVCHDEEYGKVGAPAAERTRRSGKFVGRPIDGVRG